MTTRRYDGTRAFVVELAQSSCGHPAGECMVGRPVSINRRAACSPDSERYILRLPDVQTTFPQDQPSHHAVNPPTGSTRSLYSYRRLPWPTQSKCGQTR